jgi:hypothetical protein
MKQITFMITLVFLTSACAPAMTATPPPLESVPTSTEAPNPASEFTPTLAEALVNSKLPAASFEAETYINEAAGFALDYPSGWTLKESAISDSASQIQFLSSPEIGGLAALPKGATRLTAVISEWEPRNDLPAYIAKWKTDWTSAGFAIVQEKPLVLDLGLNAVQFRIKMPDSVAVVLITSLGNQYLVLSGEGDLNLAKEIMLRLRPISH